MSGARDLVGVAFSGLVARKMRTALLLLGPMIGVAAIIAAVGLTDSAKGDLKRKVAERGTNLQRWTVLPRGGHFSFSEQPDLLAEEVRAFFRPLRSIG